MTRYDFPRNWILCGSWSSQLLPGTELQEINFFFFHFKGGKVVQVDRTPLAKIQHPLDYQYPRALFNPYFALSLASLTPLSHFLYLSEMIQFSVSVCPSSSTE